ncbi:hypothetical protein C8R47DRAFT_594050 [Mycena vitilis]|nr:hypothetical protein C8R47DRAFT_594050 [Mycena vitilis]
MGWTHSGIRKGSRPRRGSGRRAAAAVDSEAAGASMNGRWTWAQCECYRLAGRCGTYPSLHLGLQPSPPAPRPPRRGCSAGSACRTAGWTHPCIPRPPLRGFSAGTPSGVEVCEVVDQSDWASRRGARRTPPQDLTALDLVPPPPPTALGRRDSVCFMLRCTHGCEWGRDEDGGGGGETCRCAGALRAGLWPVDYRRRQRPCRVALTDGTKDAALRLVFRPG